MTKARKTLLSSALIVGALVVLGTVQMPNHNQVWREFNNSGHAVLFGLMAVAFLALSRNLLHKKFGSHFSHYALAFVVASALGAATEIIQIIGPRDADPYDFMLDVIGAASCLLIAAAFDKRFGGHASRPTNRPRPGLITLGVLLFLAAFLSPGLWATATIVRAETFPVICDFESSWQTKWIETKRAVLTVVPTPAGFSSASGTYVGRFDAQESRYPKMEFIEVYPDWRSYSRLEFDVYSPVDGPLNMALRIDDVHHNNLFSDRFNRSLQVNPGLNHFEFDLDEIRKSPRGREMDMANIARLLVFGVNTRTEFTVYIDNLRLK